jgi:hypothetical protein
VKTTAAPEATSHAAPTSVAVGGLLVRDNHPDGLSPFIEPIPHSAGTVVRTRASRVPAPAVPAGGGLRGHILAGVHSSPDGPYIPGTGMSFNRR